MHIDNIDRARELVTNEMIDAQLENMPFEIIEEKTDVYDLAVVLAGLRQLDMPHVIDWSRGCFGKCTIFVEASWFAAEFANNPNVVIEPVPEHGAMKRTIDYEGVEIFCWLKTNFVPEAA